MQIIDNRYAIMRLKELNMIFDWYYLLLVVPAIILAGYASTKVNSTYRKYSQSASQSGMTGYAAARRVLDDNGLLEVQIEKIGGNLTDHFDPKANVIRLSESVYDNPSPAAIGVAAHEAGHAIQYAKNYFPLKLRNAIVPITNLGSRLSLPLLLIGLIFSSFGSFFVILAYVGIGCFSLCALFQLLTLPTEFNASKRAIKAIDTCGLLTDEEIVGTKKVLSAAAMTYVASLLVTIMQLVRFFLLIGRNKNRR